MTTISVFNEGYVRLANVFGTELDIVNAARVSYAKESTEFSERDENLIRFLIREGHTSPLRHASLTYELYVPLLVARQHWKYAVGSTFVDDQNGWNESSRRYITEEPEFYSPDDWRLAPENSKQGSGEPLHEDDQFTLDIMLSDSIDTGMHYYEKALALGVAPEQARLFLPAYGLYVRYRWTTSLAAVTHFLSQRLADDAQKEIQNVAQAVHDLTQPHFETVFDALLP